MVGVNEPPSSRIEEEKTYLVFAIVDSSHIDAVLKGDYALRQDMMSAVAPDGALVHGPLVSKVTKKNKAEAVRVLRAAAAGIAKGRRGRRVKNV